MKEKKEKRTFKEFFYSLFIKDFDRRLESAKMTHKMIISSTNGGLSHTRDLKGSEIRGYYKPRYKFTNILPTHPLIVKYR